MSDETNILGSFGLQDTLNPKIWENADSAKDSRMKPKVREALMKIAEKFSNKTSFSRYQKIYVELICKS